MSAKLVVRRWIAAFNAHDATALAALYRPDATDHQIALEPVTGRDEIRAMFEREFAAGAVERTPENLFEDGEWAMLEWRDANGVRGCGFFHVIDGQIALQRGYWDRLSVEAARVAA